MKITFRKKARNSSYSTGGYSSQGDIDLSNLSYVPCNRNDTDFWLVAERKIKSEQGFVGSITGDLGEFKNVIAAGDIIAFSRENNVMLDTSQPSGELGLFDLTDVVITNPKRGDILVFDGLKWVNAGQITISCGNYRGY